MKQCDNGHNALLNHFYYEFIRLVFPNRCFHCGTLFYNQDKESRLNVSDVIVDYQDLKKAALMSLSEVICKDCGLKINRIASPFCSQCGMPFKAKNQEDHLCGQCIKTPLLIRQSRSFCAYDSCIKEVIHALKYQGKIWLSDALGIILFFLYNSVYNQGNSHCEQPDLIMPVPLHTKRLRKRGFNQSWLFIRKWLNYTRDYPGTQFSGILDSNTLYRAKWTPPQTGLEKKERLKNLKNAFKLNVKNGNSSGNDINTIRGKRILLVDDVYTTGTTLNECARVLLKNGAKWVDALTIARAL